MSMTRFQKTLRFAHLLQGRPYRQRLESVAEPTQLAASGLAKIRLGLMAFDCAEEDLYLWSLVIKNSIGCYRVDSPVAVGRTDEQVFWDFGTLRVRREHVVKGIYALTPGGLVYSYSSNYGPIMRWRDSFVLTNLIKV